MIIYYILYINIIIQTHHYCINNTMSSNKHDNKYIYIVVCDIVNDIKGIVYSNKEEAIIKCQEQDDSFKYDDIKDLDTDTFSLFGKLESYKLHGIQCNRLYNEYDYNDMYLLKITSYDEKLSSTMIIVYVGSKKNMITEAIMYYDNIYIYSEEDKNDHKYRSRCTKEFEKELNEKGVGLYKDLLYANLTKIDTEQYLSTLPKSDDNNTEEDEEESYSLNEYYKSIETIKKLYDDDTTQTLNKTDKYLYILYPDNIAFSDKEKAIEIYEENGERFSEERDMEENGNDRIYIGYDKTILIRLYDDYNNDDLYLLEDVYDEGGQSYSSTHIYLNDKETLIEEALALYHDQHDECSRCRKSKKGCKKRFKKKLREKGYGKYATSYFVNLNKIDIIRENNDKRCREVEEYDDDLLKKKKKI